MRAETGGLGAQSDQRLQQFGGGLVHLQGMRMGERDGLVPEHQRSRGGGGWKEKLRRRRKRVLVCVLCTVSSVSSGGGGGYSERVSHGGIVLGRESPSFGES